MRKITKVKTVIFLMTSIMFIAFSRQANAQDYTIHANTVVTWGTGGVPVPVNDITNKNIVIEAGATLNIYSTTVTMSAGKTFKIYKNAKIIIDNSIINGSWAGFRYYNFSINSPDIPGCVLIKNNSTISGADYVFQNVGGASGGIIAYNSNFVDNESITNMQGTMIDPFVYGKKAFSQCVFRNCNFYNTGCVGILDTWFVFRNLRNINFYGCGFYNDCSSVHNCISGANVKIRITGFLNASGSVTNSYFSGFPNDIVYNGSAIEIENNLSSTDSKVVINNCQFKPTTFNNHSYSTTDHAITLKGCANPEIYSNTIILESSSTNTKNMHGIYLENCSGFTLEGNNISTITPSNQNAEETYGILIQDSHDQTNQVYRNTLTNCEFGIRAQGKNRGQTQYYNQPDQGLKFLCNDFSSFNTAYYMSSVVCTGCNINNSISKFQQGALSISATDASPNFNRTPDRGLTGTQYDFYVDGSLSGYDITYLEPTYQGNYAIHYKSNNITRGLGLIPPGSPTPCESRLPCTGPNCAVLISHQNIAMFDPSFSTLKTQLADMVNGGNHDYLYNLVLNVSYSDVSGVYNELMNSTPSYDILALACSNSIFTNQMVEDILVANSYGIKSSEVRDALRVRDPQLDQQQMENIYKAAENLSEFESLMMQVDNINTEYTRLMNTSIDALLRRDSVPMDSVKLYLAAFGDFYSKIKLIEIAFSENNLTEAQTVFENISETTNDQDEIDAYSTLYNDVLQDIYANHSGDFNSMTSTQKTILYSLIGDNTYAAGIAKYLLSTYDEYQWIEDYYPIYVQSEERRANPGLTDVSDDNTRVYPNPAQNSISIVLPDDEINDAELEITDLSGRLMIYKTINASSTIDISELSNGVYLLKVKFGANVQTHKLVISK